MPNILMGYAGKIGVSREGKLGFLQRKSAESLPWKLEMISWGESKGTVGRSTVFFKFKSFKAVYITA